MFLPVSAPTTLHTERNCPIPTIPPEAPAPVPDPVSALPKKKVRFAVTTRSQAVRTNSSPPPEPSVPVPIAPIPEESLREPARSPEPDTPAPELLELPESLEGLFKEGYAVDPLPLSVLDALRKGNSRYPKITLSDCQENNGLLYYRGKLYVPALDELKAALLRLYHDSPVTGHPHRTRTFELLSRDYYWPGYYDYVSCWVRNCHSCHRAAPNRRGQEGVLRLLPIPQQAWLHISVDFITHLPRSSGYDTIFVVVDRLTKMKHFLLCYAINVKLSTTYHFETDGQTEHVNAMLEQYLRSYVVYLQDDWAEWLPLAEFACNTAWSESSCMTPFFANYSYHSRLGFEPAPVSNKPAIRDAEKLIKKMETISAHLQTELTASQTHYSKNADTRRSPARRYSVEDLVWLDARNIKTLQPQKKLDWKNLNPFKVIEMISPYAYKLELPASMRNHPVFNVNLLYPVTDDPLPGQRNPPPPPIEVEGIEQFEVEEILDSRIERRGRGGPRLKYTVKWIGYDSPIEEPAKYLEDCPKLITAFHCRYPEKPGPHNLSRLNRARA
ncbi:hypothetical protein DSL72_007514 [Monilinia vaccinii-corymbosi]|uniref:Chromo domain-containing protein n=1 Tax=Monilinia vaccinii-corymbosi TaxID=61207 RepID=A0A8A3PHV8_9HELO|nr:hypothetical protein DSL72_007514 [Monilinia vaccinii-corymbosi]